MSATSCNVPAPRPEFGVMDYGAPCPLLLFGEHRAALCYFLADVPPGWTGDAPPRVRDPATDVGPLALVLFDSVWATRTIVTTEHHAHPDYAGVNHAVVEIEGSDWAAAAPGAQRHLVFAFHDDVVEALCLSWRIEFVVASPTGLLARMRAHLAG